MKVKAIKEGFYGNSRRRVGAVFEVTEKQFSSKWMVKVEEQRPAITEDFGNEIPTLPKPDMKMRPIKKSRSRPKTD